MSSTNGFDTIVAGKSRHAPAHEELWIWGYSPVKLSIQRLEPCNHRGLHLPRYINILLAVDFDCRLPLLSIKTSAECGLRGGSHEGLRNLALHMRQLQCGIPLRNLTGNRSILIKAIVKISRLRLRDQFLPDPTFFKFRSAVIGSRNVYSSRHCKYPADPLYV